MVTFTCTWPSQALPNKSQIPIFSQMNHQNYNKQLLSLNLWMPNRCTVLAGARNTAWWPTLQKLAPYSESVWNPRWPIQCLHHDVLLGALETPKCVCFQRWSDPYQNHFSTMQIWISKLESSYAKEKQASCWGLEHGSPNGNQLGPYVICLMESV